MKQAPAPAGEPASLSLIKGMSPKYATGAEGGQGKSVQASEAQEEQSSMGISWRVTLSWTTFLCTWYFVLQSSLSALVPSHAAAKETLSQQVPREVYIFSEAAFFVSTVLNFISLIFEDTPEKKQLACLSMLIKGISCHCDHLIVTGRAVVKFDAHGAILMPSRYVQWSCSTPTIIFTLSRISDLTPAEVATAMLADWLMVVTGYMAAELPWLLGIWPLIVSFVCFGYVLQALDRMIRSALAEARSPHARACLWFTLGSTLVVWNLFWVAWVIARLPGSIAAWGEPMSIFANFAAKVVFSSSIMYNNYLTIAQRRRIAQLEQEHNERVEAVKELSSAVTRKDEFLAVIGHELRTPLNAIIQLSQALAQGAGGQMVGKGKSWLETISSSASHLLTIVNDIIMVQAVRTGSINLRQELVDVGGVLDQVLRTLMPMAKRGVVLEKVVHEKMPPMVADRRRLVQVLSNLVGNALKFTDKGKVCVKAYPDRGARHVIIKVLDTGCGIPKDKLATIFQAFSQADMSITRRHGGVGLGLAIAKELVTLHGGVVGVHSDGPGMGCAVVVKIPVLQAETDIELEAAFRRGYEAAGYKADELLSPELAVAENRVCPAFSDRPGLRGPPPGTGFTPRPSFQMGRRSIGQSAAGSTVGSSASNVVRELPTPGRYAVLGGGGDLLATSDSLTSYLIGGSGGGAGSARSSAHPARTRMEAAGAAASEGGAAGGAAAAGGRGLSPLGRPSRDEAGVQAQAQADAASRRLSNAARMGAAGLHQGGPVQAVLAEARRESMSKGGGPRSSSIDMGNAVVQHYRWSTDSENSGYLAASASQRASGEERLVQGLGSVIDEAPEDEEGMAMAAATREQGAPTMAVALASSLYAPPEAAVVASGGMPVAKSKRAALGSTHGSQVGLSEMDFREDGEGQQGGEQAAATGDHALSPSGNLPQAAGAAATSPTGLGGRRTSNVSYTSTAMTGATSAHPLYATEYEKATEVVAAAFEAQTTLAYSGTMGVQDLLGDGASPGNRQSAERAGVEGEWDSYCKTAGEGAGVADRSMAPAVVANNVRLSQQYEEAMQEAVEKNLPADPVWHSWVARIPEHHRAADGSS